MTIEQIATSDRVLIEPWEVDVESDCAFLARGVWWCSETGCEFGGDRVARRAG